MHHKRLVCAIMAIAIAGTSITGLAVNITDDNLNVVTSDDIVSDAADTAAEAADEETTDTDKTKANEDEDGKVDLDEPEQTRESEAAEEEKGEDAVITFSAAEQSGDKIPTVSVGAYDISDSVDLYAGFDYSDPQYITDELLFGEWDSKTESWVPQENNLVIKNNLPYSKTDSRPLINYDYDPELAEVEEAVKECGGSYSKPKALLLRYYRNKFSGLNKTLTINGTDVQTARANALAYNYVIDNFTAINVFDVTSDEKFYEFDVTDQIGTIVEGTGTKKFCFVLDALELDGTKASFYSRESDNKPYVTLNLTDGSTQTFYPEADATIKGGSNSGRSYPSEKELYAQQKNNVKSENDGNSQRALVRFDFSSIPSGTRVLSAVFGICGKTDKTDAPKKIFLGSTTNVTWAENGLTWNNSNFKKNLAFNSQAGMIPDVYSDKYYGMGGSASVLASRYLYDLNDIYAYHGIRYMLWYHKNIDTRAFQYNDFLAKGVNGIELATSIYSFIGSESMTPQNFAMLLKSVYCNTEWIQEGWNQPSAQLNSNHATYYNRGFAALITLFPEFYKSNAPLQDDPNYKGLCYGGRGGWIPSLQRRVLYKAKEVSFPDGAGKEVAGGYNMEAYANTVAVLQFATEANMPDILPDEYYDMMAIAALYFMHGMAPGYRDWYVGNSYGYGSQFINRPVIQQIIDGLAMLLSEDQDKSSDLYKKRKKQYDQLVYAYSGGDKGTKPLFDSILYPLARKVVMRDGWSEDAVGATMGIANGGIHCHFDDLAIVIAAYGRYLLADAGKEAYVENEPYKCWLNSTRAHNTIEINDISQRSGLWSNWEVAKGPSGENLVFPFRGSHGLVLANNVIGDAVEESENAEYKDMLDNKDYTRDNLEKLYDFDDKLAAQANSSVNPKHFQGRFLESEMNKTFDYVKGETYNNIGVVYKDDGNVLGGGSKEYTAPDNAHNRSMLFVKSNSVPSFYIVTDYVAPVNSNTQVNKYSQAWHFTNDADITMDSTTKAVKTHFDDVNLAVVPVIGEEIETEASLQDGWYHTSANVPAKYVTYVKRADKPTTFNTILLPMDSGKDYDVTTEMIKPDNLKEEQASAFNFTMRDVKTNKTVEGTYYNLHDTDVKSERKVGEYTTDARILYMDKSDTTYTTAIVADATSVKDESGRYLIKSNENISHLGVEWRGNGLYLSTSAADEDNAEYVDLSKLTILNERNVSGVYLNDEAIDYKAKDGYVYFGDTPILPDGTVTPSETPKPSQSQKPSSGHAGGGGGGSSSGSKPSTPVVSPKPQPTPTPSENVTGEINSSFAKEIENHWGKNEITALVKDKVVSGVSDTSLGLKQNVTRAEFAAMLIRALGIKTDGFNNEFPDVSPDAWYADILAAAKNNGILDGDDAGNANPDDYITREQMAKIAVQILGGDTDNANNEEYTDSYLISDWAKKYVYAAQRLGIMQGMEDKSFAPKDMVPREQAMVLTYRIREKYGK